MFASSQPRIGAKTMTDKKNFADRARDHADDDSPQAHQAPDRRRWTDVMKHFWPALVGLVVGALAVVESTGEGGLVLGMDVCVFSSVLTLVIAAVYLPIGAVRRELGGRGVLAFEMVGALFFGALALAALLVDRQLAHYLLAAAFLGHAAWDFAHHRAEMVVPRWYAEFCVVIDVILAAGLLLAAP